MSVKERTVKRSFTKPSQGAGNSYLKFVGLHSDP